MLNINPLLNLVFLRLFFVLSIIFQVHSVLSQSNFLKTYNAIGFQDVNSIAQDSDHNFILVGQSQVTAGGTPFTFVVKTDRDGNILWRKYFGDQFFNNTGNQVLNTPKGYIVLGNELAIGASVTLFDSDGNIVTQTIEKDSLWYAHSMDLTSDNGLIIAGEN